MSWWNILLSNINTGNIINTPGRGQSGFNSSQFEIVDINNNELKIKSGKSEIRIEKECFEVVEDFFLKHPYAKLRIASLHDSSPLPDSVDKLIREKMGSDLARGNYVSAILEACRLVNYSMTGRKKVIGLP